MYLSQLPTFISLIEGFEGLKSVYDIYNMCMSITYWLSHLNKAFLES